MSVRQRAVDLLYAMCDRSNAPQIVAEMLSYLETADYSIREEIVSSDVTAPDACWKEPGWTGGCSSVRVPEAALPGLAVVRPVLVRACSCAVSCIPRRVLSCLSLEGPGFLRRPWSLLLPALL